MNRTHNTPGVKRPALRFDDPPPLPPRTMRRDQLAISRDQLAILPPCFHGLFME
jgi:hypothetical protein